jgi:hypothetical protein
MECVWFGGLGALWILGSHQPAPASVGPGASFPTFWAHWGWIRECAHSTKSSASVWAPTRWAHPQALFPFTSTPRQLSPWPPNWGPVAAARAGAQHHGEPGRAAQAAAVPSEPAPRRRTREPRRSGVGAVGWESSQRAQCARARRGLQASTRPPAPGPCPAPQTWRRPNCTFSSSSAAGPSSSSSSVPFAAATASAWQLPVGENWGRLKRFVRLLPMVTYSVGKDRKKRATASRRSCRAGDEVVSPKGLKGLYSVGPQHTWRSSTHAHGASAARKAWHGKCAGVGVTWAGPALAVGGVLWIFLGMVTSTPPPSNKCTASRLTPYGKQTSSYSNHNINYCSIFWK